MGKRGPKPHTRRARGLPPRMKPYHHSEAYIAKLKAIIEAEQAEIKRERELEKAERLARHSGLPKSADTLKQYAFMYNWFHRAYEWYRDEDVAYTSTEEKFKVKRLTVKRAISVITYLKEHNQSEDNGSNTIQEVQPKRNRRLHRMPSKRLMPRPKRKRKRKERPVPF